MTQETAPALELVVLILARAPVAGRVKTRLCPPATPAQAADIAAAALLDTLEVVRLLPGGRPVVALTGGLAHAERAAELASALRDVPVIEQRGEKLGERIAAAYEDTAALVPGLPILLMGMDTPQLNHYLLDICRSRLWQPEVDVVLGPASDGGCWALGLRDPSAAYAIAAVETSRPDTCVRVVQALRHKGFRIATLPVLSDVDTMEDAIRVAALAPRTRFASVVSRLL
ncbi:DUF2064 domain-containing protein [Actinomadura sp. DC4]|uniref:TIGR04282 family arsenosugar biosynthesis glycosyltransferase n=1 Tax=Actinomadura sp. DC4 TaxID=3055069 RepID=UPI0025B27BBB|nr:DUF2064 domain-containing protein [Actinomadura sp. DC4]MDN3354894.1 DUF2064 domain-containing protein [Actinomadura sp. DC4]